MKAPRLLLVSGLLGLTTGCIDYGPQGYISTPVANAPPFGPGSVTSVDQFTGALAPFGQWLQTPQWGRVWQPAVAPGWQPYTVGRWLDDPNYGRTWLGDEPWSWATDHYGRWGYDAQLGWFWVPGMLWAPAWVAWRDGDSSTGWAPLPPLIGGAAFGYDSWSFDQWYAPSWVFVPRGALYAPYTHRPRIPADRDRDQWNSTRPRPPAHGGQWQVHSGGWQGNRPPRGDTTGAPPPAPHNGQGHGGPSAGAPHGGAAQPARPVPQTTPAPQQTAPAAPQRSTPPPPPPAKAPVREAPAKEPE